MPLLVQKLRGVWAYKAALQVQNAKYLGNNAVMQYNKAALQAQNAKLVGDNAAL